MAGEVPTPTTRSFGEDLRRLRALVGRTGSLAGRQAADATAALVQRDVELAAEVARRNAELDRLEREIDAFCIRLVALLQPVAADLRLIVAALKLGHDPERIGDHAANTAGMAQDAARGETFPSAGPKADASASVVARPPGAAA